jgi:hypothetical protein
MGPCGDERNGGHQDRAQAQLAGFERRLDDALALEFELARELHAQNRVLAGQAPQHDQPELDEGVVVARGTGAGCCRSL